MATIVDIIHRVLRMTIMVDIKLGVLGGGVAAACVFALAACGGGGPAPAVPAAAKKVPATREPLATDSRSAVVHDTEVDALTAHSGRLFAATDQWEYPGPSGYGQVLVKN